MKRFPTLIVLHLTVLTVIQLSEIVQTANILVWGAVGSHSIRLSMEAVMDSLAADKNHNITYVTIFEDFESDPKKKKIQTFVPKLWKDAMGPTWEKDGSTFCNLRKKLYASQLVWYDVRNLGITSCELLYSDPEFIEFVKNSPKYDLVIVEMLMNECVYGLVHMWNSKLIMYSSTSVLPNFFDAYGLPFEGITDIFFGFPSGKEMSFYHRMISAIHPIIFSLTKEHYYLPKLEEITRRGWKVLGMNEDDVPSFSEVERNTSLVLLSTHFSMEYARSFPPNVIPVGGAVLAKKQKPLPKEMAEFLNSAKDGFIFISFGTLTEFTNFDKPIQKEFIEALKAFPNIKFVWKSSSSINYTLPDNILVTPWAPQQTILGHKNIKLFISHSGMGSTAEAIQFAVPVISIPILAEQDHNSEALCSKGAGIRLEIIGLKREQLQQAISEILENNKYSNKMEQISAIFKDRPTPPVEVAVWWIEYVLRHENVNEFLRSPSATQPWWKRRQIDVWLTAVIFFLVTTVLSTYLLYTFVMRIFALIFKTRAKNKIKTN